MIEFYKIILKSLLSLHSIIKQLFLVTYALSATLIVTLAMIVYVQTPEESVIHVLFVAIY